MPELSHIDPGSAALLVMDYPRWLGLRLRHLPWARRRDGKMGTWRSVCWEQ